jgi:hypothetical protein
MSSVHRPQEKKRLAYLREHYAKGKHDKAFRKGWPTKKRKAIRSFRHAADGMTKAAALDEGSDARISAIKQKPLSKWPVRTLKERLAQNLDKRARRIGAKRARHAARE